jgi:hypothetical protein
MVFLSLSEMDCFFSYIASVIYRFKSVIKTYAWIVETPVSINDKINLVTHIGVRMFIFINMFPINDSSKCPDTKLAINRMDRVSGRIRFLIISITTIKFIRATGVPVGVMCVIIFFVFFNHPIIIGGNHKANVMGMMSIICAVAE